VTMPVPMTMTAMTMTTVTTMPVTSNGCCWHESYGSDWEHQRSN
jgi:hypothetical protein